jgi:hypothetical protein
MMESESLFIVDDSPDHRLESARQQGVSNVLNKIEGAQMEHERRIRITKGPTQVQRDRIAQNKRNYRNRKRQNDSNQSRQARLDTESQRIAKFRRLEKEMLNIKYTEEREALIEKANQRYPFILVYIDFFQDL